MEQHLSEEHFIRATKAIQESVVSSIVVKEGETLGQVYRLGNISLTVISYPGWSLIEIKIKDQLAARRQIFEKDSSYEIVNQHLEQRVLKELKNADL